MNDTDEIFRILLIGDFSNSGGAHTVTAPMRVDRDTIDEAVASLGPQVSPGGLELKFANLDDFHPDQLIPHLPTKKASQPAAPPPPPSNFSGSLLDAMLDEAQPAPTKVEDANDLAGFIKRVTAGHIVPKEGPAVADPRGEILRALLHFPEFQALESVWRSASLVVDGIEDDAHVRIYLLDTTLPGLVRNLDAVSAAMRAIGKWGCLAAAFTFGQSATEVEVLRRLSDWGKSVGAPFLAGAAAPDGSPSPEWKALRASAEARWIGLALPRFILRLPYGKSGSVIDSFPFEELDGNEHSHYLWGAPAFLCAFLLGQSFTDGQLHRRISGLPMHVYREDGEAYAKPCAEVWLTEREAETLIDAGLIPIASIKNEDSVMVVRYQSIANPSTSLAGVDQMLAKHRSMG